MVVAAGRPKIFAHLQPAQPQVLRKKRWLWGYVAALRLEDGTPLIGVTQFKSKRAIADYAHRWGIGTRFSICKSRRYCLKATHLREAQRVSKPDASTGVGLEQWSVVASGRAPISPSSRTSSGPRYPGAYPSTNPERAGSSRANWGEAVPCCQVAEP
ncbi:hypothetical protein XM38_014130 [Halomicronema hongdechloris C2206]|uniref:Uncharacterized protein n=1 Tax=Halomicronema hongdechloris C2206 TaxID=1641165 RepID=A0A1Z3HJH2_9CYAN|nr:hypothetical protein XM38_014130 [Halomicronema hongdechloris C2206]